MTDHAVRSVKFLDYERIVTGTSDHPKIVRVRVVHWHNRYNAFAGEKNKRATTSKSYSFIISWAESYNDRRHFHPEGISPARNTRARNLSKIPTHWHFKCLTAGNLIISQTCQKWAKEGRKRNDFLSLPSFFPPRTPGLFGFLSLSCLPHYLHLRDLQWKKLQIYCCVAIFPTAKPHAEIIQVGRQDV